MSLQDKLSQGLVELGIDLDAATQLKLLDYLALLEKWNKVHNLTAVRDPNDMVTLHLLDSLSVLPHIESGRLLDVGSGAGLPGIPLAIVWPDLQVTVMDSNHKKASFMRQAKAALAIANLEVVCGRVEDFHPEHKFDMIISRAFSDIAEFMRLTAHLCVNGGVWLAMKGVYPYDELAQIKGPISEVIPLNVPGLEAQRHLVFLKAA
ncbi:16S rRNA (guanine(527)-N(7))-methyltransferase [Methylobacillus sp. MM3]|uniref:16S rRNA (guanine(527)-N(7))-methyltransferase RsmG n=1 Tax=Methylobacillus sp. MM3 TaxID=1848039 RepID=UPI0007E0571F|nr:16S rRNA (guanine(527)-N(7))-methyltransferase RsmG [Methylobacillus sp. MM3]OAJ70523.1 16S rRNA (guanine(527)-N(7))-methyltransferase [Methylobacillus sp. MM3]